jgi:hypothetical protein
MRTMSEVRDGDHIEIYGDGDIVEIVMLYWTSCYEINYIMRDVLKCESDVSLCTNKMLDLYVYILCAIICVIVCC